MIQKAKHYEMYLGHFFVLFKVVIILMTIRPGSIYTSPTRILVITASFSLLKIAAIWVTLSLA